MHGEGTLEIRERKLSGVCFTGLSMDKALSIRSLGVKKIARIPANARGLCYLSTIEAMVATKHQESSCLCAKRVRMEEKRF